MPDQENIATPESLKVTVLASGKILLDGSEVNLSRLEEVLIAAKSRGALVRYDRENATGPAPPEAEAVMNLITSQHPRIALSGVSNVIEMPGLETLFAKVRRYAGSNRGVSLLRPDRTHFILPAPPQGSIGQQMVDGVKAVIPSDQPRNIAAIVAPGVLAGDSSQKPSLPAIAKRVPFMGLLVGIAYAGHAVWMFEASAETAAPGSEDADVLIVDSDAVAAMPQDWAVDAALVMRNPNVLVYDRSRHKIGAMRTAGEVPGRIEFPN